MDIYYKSDFTLIETFLDENGTAIDMTAIDFKIDYYTLSNTKYTASKTGAVYVNCEAGSATNQLNVFFAKHGMPAGKLQREITLYITNPGFSPTQKVITNPVSDIILVAKGGDSATASSSVVYPAIVVPPTYYDIKDLTDSTGLRASWTAKIGIEDLQDATTKDDIIDADEVNYLDSENNFSLVKTTWLNIKAKLKTYFDTLYEPKKSTGENYVSDAELEVLQNTSGENTGDETAESIIDKIGTDGQIKSDYLPSYVDDVIEGYYFEAAFYSDSAHTELITAEQGKIYVDIPTNFSYRYSGSAYINISNPLDYSTDIEADKTSTTKVSAIKTLYDWATGKFIALSKLVTSWSATPLDTNLASEKLVKDSLNLKADITPANGSTSALRALFIARGYYKQTNTYYCVYNANTGYYEMNGLTDLTEAQMADIYINTAVQINIGIAAVTSFTCMSYSNIRTSFPRTTSSGYDSTNDINRFRGCDKLEVYKNYEYYGHISYACGSMFNGCSELHTVDFLNLTNITNVIYAPDCFTGCVKLVTANVKNLKISFSFKDCPLLSLASLQYLVTNRANGTSTITITVHETVWDKLHDAANYQAWNDLLVDAMANQHIDFARA